MTDRLLVVYSDGRKGAWSSDFATPRLFGRAVKGVQGDARVYSPRYDTLAPMDAFIFSNGSTIALAVLGEAGAAPRNQFETGQGALLVSTDAPISLRPGFMLVDESRQPIAMFRPPLFGKDAAGWPDWSVHLALQGLMLFHSELEDAGAGSEGMEQVVLLAERAMEAPKKATRAWINPLIVAFRNGRVVPGYRDSELTDLAAPFEKLVARQTLSGPYALIPRSSPDTLRRLLGWRAVFGSGAAKNSALGGLFDGRDRDCLRNLAVLDALGGAFVAEWDAGLLEWTWNEPDGLDDCGRQLVDDLTRRLGLRKTTRPFSVDTRRWGGTKRSASEPSFVFAAGDDPRDMLGSLVEHLGKTADAPLLRTVIVGLATELADLSVSDVSTVLSPLMGRGIARAVDGLLVKPEHLVSGIARHFFAPVSRVLFPLDAVELAPRVDSKTFLAEWRGADIDLFSSHSLGPIATLRLLTSGERAPEGADEHTRWRSSLWRHAVVGNAARPFLITSGATEFRLDMSSLDVAPLAGVQV